MEWRKILDMAVASGVLPENAVGPVERALELLERVELAEHAFKLYLKRIRMGPLATDKPRAEHPPSDLYPHQRAYWERRAAKPVGIGHLFKYPYGFYGLMGLLGDGPLKERCRQVAYHVL